jgi:hypothetical protein
MKAKNLSKSFWKVNEKKATFTSQRAYGVVNNKSQALSSDGVNPSTWHTMKIAKEIAEYCEGFKGYSWVNLYQ